MLQIEIPVTSEGWDEKTETFIEAKTKILQLEHSLISISKWESKWCKPFLSNKSMTLEEELDYIKCMTLTQNVEPELYNRLTPHNLDQIVKYINAPMTATTFREDKTNKGNREIVTAELIYHWMIELNIPFECRKWHLNQLLTLIKVRNIKLTPPKKRSKRDIMSQNAALNAARRQQLNSKG